MQALVRQAVFHGLIERLKEVEEVGAARGGIYPGDGTEAGAIDPEGVVIDAGAVGFLHAVDEEGQLPVIHASGLGGIPFHFNLVRLVGDGKPLGI